MAPAWTPAAASDLLFCILASEGKPSPNWNKVVEMMKELDHVLTASAAQQYFNKRLWTPFTERRNASTAEDPPASPSAADAAAPGSPTTPATGKKKALASAGRKRKTPANPGSSATKRRAATAPPAEDEDAEPTPTPVKKTKADKSKDKPKAKAKAKSKEETDDNMDEGKGEYPALDEEDGDEKYPGKDARDEDPYGGTPTVAADAVAKDEHATI